MVENTNNPSLNLAGEAIEKKSLEIKDVLTIEQRLELENINYLELGKDDYSCIVLPKPLEKSYHFQLEHFSNMDVVHYTANYLLFGMDKDKKAVPKVLTFLQYQPAEGVVYNNSQPLIDFNEMIQKRDENELNACLYQSHDRYDLFSYKNWIVATEGVENIAGVGVNKAKEMFLKEASKVDYSQVMDLNKKKTIAIPSAA